MVNRFGIESILLQPGGRPDMQAGDQIGLRLLQPGAQQIGKEVVIAIPRALIIQGHQKEVCPFQVFQNGSRIGRESEIGSLLSTFHLESRLSHHRGGLSGAPKSRLQKKMLDFWRLAGQDLLQQVVQNVAVGAREAFDEPEHVLAIPHGESRHLQAGNPAFGTLFEQRPPILHPGADP